MNSSEIYANNMDLLVIFITITFLKGYQLHTHRFLESVISLHPVLHMYNICILLCLKSKLQVKNGTFLTVLGENNE